jgi:hypothetical protein
VDNCGASGDDANVQSHSSESVDLENDDPKVQSRRKKSIWLWWGKRAIHPISLWTVALVLIGYWQYLTTTGQLQEMKSSSRDTQQLLRDNREQIEALKRSAEAAQRSASAAERNAAAAQQSATAAADTAAAAKMTAQVGNDALTSVQRAFITPKSLHQVRVFRHNEKNVDSWRFFMEWENSGSTPTRNARTRINYLRISTELPANFTFPDFGSDPTIPIVFGPKAVLSSTQLPIPTATMASVQQHRLHLYIWGWTAYNDVFRSTKLHVTEFCRELTEISGNLETGEQISFLFSTCAQHNCIDEECNDYEQMVQRHGLATVSPTKAKSKASK